MDWLTRLVTLLTGTQPGDPSAPESWQRQDLPALQWPTIEHPGAGSQWVPPMGGGRMLKGPLPMWVLDPNYDERSTENIDPWEGSLVNPSQLKRRDRAPNFFRPGQEPGA